jgi:hypothetical protein
MLALARKTHLHEEIDFRFTEFCSPRQGIHPAVSMFPDACQNSCPVRLAFLNSSILAVLNQRLADIALVQADEDALDFSRGSALKSCATGPRCRVQQNN